MMKPCRFYMILKTSWSISNFIRAEYKLITAINFKTAAVHEKERKNKIGKNSLRDNQFLLNHRFIYINNI